MTYDKLEEKMLSIGSKINVPPEYYPKLKCSSSFEDTYIEIKFPFLYYIAIEYGKEVERRKFTNTDDLFYAVFKDITHTMAMWYEAYNRIENQDFRKILFSKQIELLSKICPEYAIKRQKEINEILTKYPYIDE